MSQGFIDSGKLAGIGNHGIIGSGNVAAFKYFFDQRHERLTAVLVLCGKQDRLESKHFFNLLNIFFYFFRVKKIALITNSNDGNTHFCTFGHMRKNSFILFIQAAGQIEDGENQFRLFQRLDASLYANAFHEIIRTVYACGIGETKRDITCSYGFGNNVSRRSRDVGNNGTFFFRKQIQNGGFTGIGLTENNGANAFTNSMSRFVGAAQFFQCRDGIFNTGTDFFFRKRGKILVREIDDRINAGYDVTKIFIDGVRFTADRASEIQTGKRK